MKKLYLITLSLLSLGFGLQSCRIPGPPCEAKNETVVLLHGLARSGKAMKKLEKHLIKEGYAVINYDYPSTSDTIEELSNGIFRSLEPKLRTEEKVHFVTHSMGGMILREHLEHQSLPNLGRVVMLAPPSRGSEVTDKLGHLFLYQWINGPAGGQLGTGADSHPLRLKAPDFELGIIAGDRSINPILSLLIPGQDDGKVALTRVKPESYSDYLQLHTTHATMMWNQTVIDQTINFLNGGQFIHSTSRTSNRSGLYRAMYAHHGAHPLRRRPRP